MESIIGWLFELIRHPTEITEVDIYVARTGHESNRVILEALLRRVDDLEKDMVAIRGREHLPGALTRLQTEQERSAASQGARLGELAVEIGKIKTDLQKLNTSQTDTRARLTAGVAVVMAILGLVVGLLKIFAR